MAAEPLLVDNSSNLAHYVFVFPNFFSHDPEVQEILNKQITEAKFKTIFNSIFKIIDEDSSHELLDLSSVSRNQDRSIASNSKKKPKDREFSKSFQLIKASRDNFLRDTQNGFVQWGRVLKLIFENIIVIFEKDLHLHFDLFYSRDKDEIFMKIKATEKNLQIQADLIDYQVQVEIERPGVRNAILLPGSAEFSKRGYSLVSPYGEFQFKNKKENVFDVYKTFDPHERKNKDPDKKIKDSKALKKDIKDGFSVFRYKDKVKLVTAMITSVVDLGELLENQIITANYCLHNKTQLREFRNNWGAFSKFYNPQDFKLIRMYFGEKISMYFAFLEYYIIWLIFPSLIGLAAFVVWFMDKKMYQFDEKLDLFEIILLFFSLFMSVGSTVLDQLWVRRENKLAWMWGTTDLVEIEQQRPAFKGVYMTDPITGIKKKIQTGAFWARVKRSIGFSITVFFTVSVLTLIIFLTVLKSTSKYDPRLFSMLNAMQIKVMNFFHRLIARKMTDWENYEYDSEFNNALTIKLYMFQFINSYASLFYIAFIKDKKTCKSSYDDDPNNPNCMRELQEQLFWILVLNTLMNGFELGFPYIKEKYAEWKENKRIQAQELTKDNKTPPAHISYIEKQSKLAVYDTPLDDYMELVINYGYVVMFSVACPLFPLFSLLLNILEVRVDAYKLCYLCQRPNPIPANSIGTWVSIIRTVSLIGALTNTAILVFTSDVFDLKVDNVHNYENGMMLMYFLLLEHALLAIKYVLVVVLDPEPRVVKEGLIWSKRIAAEKIYGKASNLEHQRANRGLEFKGGHEEHFVLKPDRIKDADFN